MDSNLTNEMDVREDVAAPLLSLLGYKRGAQNDILREFSLSYDHHFLGRKKKNDPPLRGRADYVLSVRGAGRWVLETKPPSEDITQDAIEQTISYARHPEVSGTYAAVLNGKRFVVFHNSQKSNDTPIAELQVQSPEQLAAQLCSLLSPSAIRRDCSPPIVDLRMPLADGFRSRAGITGGTIAYSKLLWECNVPLPEPQKTDLDEISRRMSTTRYAIIGGSVWRDDTSRIKAKLEWAFPHDQLLQFAQDKNLLNAEYVSLSEQISSDPANPTVFEVVGSVSVAEGDILFDILRWDTQVAGIALSMTVRGQAVGYISDRIFNGSFQSEFESSVPTLPEFSLNMYAIGKFSVVLDGR